MYLIRLKFVGLLLFLSKSSLSFHVFINLNFMSVNFGGVELSLTSRKIKAAGDWGELELYNSYNEGIKCSTLHKIKVVFILLL